MGTFREIGHFALDFEFYAPDGAIPSPHCLAVRELRSGAVIRLLREDFTLAPPYGVGSDSLVLAYAAAAELRCHLALGWSLPENLIDLCVESRLRFNTPGPDRGCPGLVEALERFGIPHLDPVEKKQNQNRFGKPELTDDDKKIILDYCESDVTPLARLLTCLLPDMDIDKALARGAFVREMAVVEHRGIPIAVKDYEKINRNRKQIRFDLIARSPVKELYPKGSFNYKKLDAWLKKKKINDWPRTPNSDRFILKESYLKKAAANIPPVQPLLDLTRSLKAFKRCTFDIGPDGRTHADQIPFGTISGRNAPSGFVLVAAKFWRWAVRAPKGYALIYCDYSNEEFGVAAFLSGDENMIAGYELPDVYQSVADQLGISRKFAKIGCLATQYGAGPRRLENSLGVPYSEAEKIFRYHKQTYARYWRWSDQCLEELKAKSVFEIGGDGWALRLGDVDVSDNANALLTSRNFPIQGTAAAILRRVAIETGRAGIETIGPLHDALLVQAPVRDAKKISARTRQIMRDVSKQFLGHEIRVASEIYRDRFEDKDGAEEWARISEILKKYK